MKRSWAMALSIAFLLTGSSLLAQDGDLRPDAGVLNGRRYMNGYFGFSYRFPEGWVGSAVQHRNISTNQMYPLFSANPQAVGASDVRYVSINADFLPPNTTVKSPKDFLELAAHTLSEAFDPLHTDKRCVFGGKQFYRVDMKSKVVPGTPVFYQTQIATFLRSYAVTFSFMASNSDDLEELVRTMESLAFFEPGGLPAVPGPQVQVAKSDGQPHFEEKATTVPASPVQVASSAPTVEPKSVEAKISESAPASAMSPPIATLAGRPEPAPNAVTRQAASEGGSTAARAPEVPAVASSFVASAPRAQTISPTPITHAEVTAPPASQKTAELPAQPTPRPMTATKVSEPVLHPDADSAPAQTNGPASESAVEAFPAQVQVSTVSSSLPDQIQPITPAAISTKPGSVLGASAAVTSPPASVSQNMAPAKSASTPSSDTAAPTTQKKVYIPASLASPPSAALPERVSVVSADGPVRAAASPTPPSTLIQATHKPSNGSAEPAATSAPASAVNQHSSAPVQLAAAVVPSTASAAPPTADPTARLEPKAGPAPTTLAMNTPPISVANAARPSRVQVSTAELEANITRKTLPTYPMVAKNFRVEGLVLVNVVVDRNGNVVDAKAVTGPPLLLRGAEAAVRQWRFKPYLVDGTPVEMESQIPLNFRLAK